MENWRRNANSVMFMGFVILSSFVMLGLITVVKSVTIGE